MTNLYKQIDKQYLNIGLQEFRVSNEVTQTEITKVLEFKKAFESILVLSYSDYCSIKYVIDLGSCFNRRSTYRYSLKYVYKQDEILDRLFVGIPQKSNHSSFIFYKPVKIEGIYLSSMTNLFNMYKPVNAANAMTQYTYIKVNESGTALERLIKIKQSIDFLESIGIDGKQLRANTCYV